MADLEDVTATLVGILSGITYPNGLGAPPIAGFASRVLPGWPNPAQLDKDLKENRTIVSVYPRAEERNTTRYALQWQEATINSPTLSVSHNGVRWTVSGTVPPASAENPHIVMVMANYRPYVYAVQPSDTLPSIAAALAGIAAVGIPGTVSAGPVITFPANTLITAARVGVTGTSGMEIRRQERLFQIGIWANSPMARSAIAKAIDPVLANMPFINLPDLFAGRLRYKSSLVSDASQKQLLYRRDLFYTVEYPTTQFRTDTQITQEQLNISALPSGTLIETIYISNDNVDSFNVSFTPGTGELRVTTA